MTDEILKLKVEAQSTPIESVILFLKDENRPFTFNSVEVLDDFIEKEKKHWEWLSISDSAIWKEFSNYLKTNLVNVIISKLSEISSLWENEDWEELNKKLIQFEELLTCIDFPFSCRKTGKAIASESKVSFIVAVNMLYLCSVPKSDVKHPGAVNIANKLINISKLNLNGRLPLPLTRAFFDSEVYRLKANRILTKIELFGTNGGVGEIVESLSGVSSAISNIQAECEESSVDLESWKKSKKIEYAEWVTKNEQELDSLGKKLLRKVLSVKTKYIRNSSETLKSTEETVLKAKEVYLSQVELAAAVTYWEGKKGTHKDSKNLWLRILVTLLVITSTSPFLIMEYLPVKNVAADKLLLNVLNPITVITSLLVISLLSFSIRLCSRQFSTQQHLFLEAEERKTMLKTYLALMNEGKLVEQEDRKIALDALFRPAQTGMVTESGNIVPSDSVIKIFERQSSPTKT